MTPQHFKQWIKFFYPHVWKKNTNELMGYMTQNDDFSDSLVLNCHKTSKRLPGTPNHSSAQLTVNTQSHMKRQTHWELQSTQTQTTACNRGQTHNTCFPEHCVQACCVFVIEFTVHRITETVLANNCLSVFKTQFINDTSAFLEEEARITVSQQASYIC